MTRFEAFAALFNQGRLAEALGEVADGYTYTDPVFGTVRGKDAHLNVMQQVLAAYPDRAIHVIRAWAAGDLEFAEYRWQGTPAAGGDRVDSQWAVVIEYAQDRLLRQRHYRG
jgi:predicted SnoaL-like aldol condensation-catalyzing enzyme